MGVRRTNGQSFFETERRAQKRLDMHLEETEEIVEDAMRLGENVMKDIINTSGVEDTVSTGGPRVRTGAMYDAVKRRTRRTGRDTIVGRFGFLPGDQEAYYRFQDEGTRQKGEPRGNPRPGGGTGNRGIVPMMAFKHAKDEVDNYLADRLGRRS